MTWYTLQEYKIEFFVGFFLNRYFANQSEAASAPYKATTCQASAAIHRMCAQYSRRNQRITFALTASEYQRVVRAARSTGLTRAAYARAATLKKNIDKKVEEEFVRILLALIRRLEMLECDKCQRLAIEHVRASIKIFAGRAE